MNLVNLGLAVRCKTSSSVVDLEAERCIRERILYEIQHWTEADSSVGETFICFDNSPIYGLIRRELC